MAQGRSPVGDAATLAQALVAHPDSPAEALARTAFRTWPVMDAARRREVMIVGTGT